MHFDPSQHMRLRTMRRYSPLRPMRSAEETLRHPIHRPSATGTLVRQQLSAQNRSIARGLGLVSAKLHRFADTLDALDPERRGTLSLRANVLMMTDQVSRQLVLPKDLPHPHKVDVGVVDMLEHPGFLAALCAPVKLGSILNPDRFTALQDLRIQAADLLPRLHRDLLHLHHVASDMALGPFSQMVRGVALLACGIEARELTVVLDQAA